MSSGISFTCDSCGREVFGCNIVNGMKFCAKCYQETFGETEKDRKITELQSQLAEKEKEIEQVTSKLPASYEKEQNQKAIQVLEELSRYFRDYDNYSTHTTYEILYQIKRKIKGLKGEE